MNINDYEAAKRAAINDARKPTLPIWGDGGCITAPGTISPPRDVSEIERLLGTQENAIAELMLTIDRLRERLVPVMLISAASKDGCAPPSPTQSPLGARIHTHNEQLWSQIARLRHTIEELCV